MPTLVNGVKVSSKLSELVVCLAGTDSEIFRRLRSG